MKKFISPQSWFSFSYPDSWFEFSEEPDCFLFYNPNQWEGNFRISAHRDNNNNYGNDVMRQELRRPGAKVVKVGPWDAIYTSEDFSEKKVRYTTHEWLIGCGPTCVECSLTIPEGKSDALGKKMVASLELMKPGQRYHQTYIPLRASEENLIEQCYATIEDLGNRLFKTRFKELEDNMALLQKLVGRKELTQQLGDDAGSVMGIALCALLSESMDGLSWQTYIDGDEEMPVLCYKGKCIAHSSHLLSNDPQRLSESCINDILSTLRQRIEEVEAC